MLLLLNAEKHTKGQSAQMGLLIWPPILLSVPVSKAEGSWLAVLER
jgi:hypothetical protein